MKYNPDWGEIMAIALVYHNNPTSNCFTDLKFATFDMTHAGQGSYWFGVSDGRNVDSKEGSRIINLSCDYGGISGFLGVGRNSSKPGVRPTISYCTKLGSFALAFDGYIINGPELMERYGGRNDAELAAMFIADANDFFKGAENLAGESKGHFNLTVAGGDGCGYAVRYPGIRPLIYGRNDKGQALVSESRALSHIRMELVRDIDAGEAVMIDGSGLHTIGNIPCRKVVCSFLWPYYQMKDCITEGIAVAEVKDSIGRWHAEMDERDGIDSDVAVPVPNSGKGYEEEYADRRGCRHSEALFRYEYAGRSYDEPEQWLRDLVAGVKLSIIPHKVRGKRVAVFDDSIRRGTQMVREYGPIWLLNSAEPKEIHLRVCSPKNKMYCRCSPPEKDRYEDERLAANRFPTDEALAKHLGVNTVRFIDEDAFIDCIIQGSNLSGEELCMGCYNKDFSFLGIDV